MNVMTSDDQAMVAQSVPKPLIQSMHHISYRCYDPEATRHFYEDILELEFAAAIPGEVEIDGVRHDALEMMFRMDNGDFLYFYHIPGIDRPDVYKPFGPMDLHLGMKVKSKAEWEFWVERMKSFGVEYIGPLDHEFIESIYFFDPNGTMMEITYEYDSHEEFMDRERAIAHEVVKDWHAKTWAGKDAANKAARG